MSKETQRKLRIHLQGMEQQIQDQQSLIEELKLTQCGPMCDAREKALKPLEARADRQDTNILMLLEVISKIHDNAMDTISLKGKDIGSMYIIRDICQQAYDHQDLAEYVEGK